jgi:transcriptional regulator NrdR family protein
MTKNDLFNASFYKGLQALSDSSFPKMCSNCGRIYKTVEAYISQTESVSKTSGLQESLDDDEKPIVELFRNCVCGSTLMNSFNSRRDQSETGLKRRKKFGELLEKLTKAGYTVDVARDELLKIMRGEESILLKKTKKS